MTPLVPFDLDPTVLPPGLCALAPPLGPLTAVGDVSPARGPVVAIVGSRDASEAALAFTSELATACVEAGFVVASGGAFGIDARAHEATLDARGRTWCVLPTGPCQLLPHDNLPLFQRIAHDGGALLWPFSAAVTVPNYFARNKVLAALSHAVVVIQAARRSGARNTARWARELGVPLWVAPAAPWMEGFDGNHLELEGGARPLTSVAGFVRAVLEAATPSGDRRRRIVRGAQLALSVPPPLPRPLPADLNPEEKQLAAACGATPRHLDELALEAGLSPPTAATALLTLVLEHVLVEGPAGHYRRPP